MIVTLPWFKAQVATTVTTVFLILWTTTCSMASPPPMALNKQYTKR